MGKYKQFIQDAYNGKHLDMCSDWKELIRKEFPELFKSELYVGKWFKGKGETLAYITRIDGLELYGYGFGSRGTWFDDNDNEYWLEKDHNFKEATSKQVEAALINEAKKRGFKEGVEYMPLWEGLCKKHLYYKAQNLNTKLSYNKIYNGLDGGFGFIFQNGKWAEIIKPKKMTLKEVEKELGYNIELV